MKKMTEIIWYDTIDSTNSQARRLLERLTSPTVIAAREQTAGRGQRGNSWNSEPGNNLTFSLVIKKDGRLLDNIPVTCQFVISEAVALGVADYLATEDVPVKIKWPNDIYAGNSKICGILIENTVASGEMTSCIAGVGLNLNQTGFPCEIPNPVSLTMITGRKYCLEDTLVRLVSFIIDRLASIHDDPEKLRREYLDILYRKDECHKYVDMNTGEEFEGCIRGISDSARLQVEIRNGTVREYSFKEIGYIIA